MLIQKLLQDIREHQQMLNNVAEDSFRDKVRHDLELLEKQLTDQVDSLLTNQELLQNCMRYDSLKNNTIFTALDRINLAQMRGFIFDQYNYINGHIGVTDVRWQISLTHEVLEKVIKITPEYEY